MKIPVDLRRAKSLHFEFGGTVDAETKEALLSILAGEKTEHLKSRKKSAPRTEDPSIEMWRERVEKERAANSLKFGAIGVVANTSNETAVLSVNASKACIVLRASFTRATLRELESLNENGKIKWNDKDEVMELNPTLLPQVKLILKNNYKDVNVLSVQKQVKATKFDLLFNKLDSDDKKKIYALLARKHHPDLGGNKDTMALVNSVFKGGD